MGRYTKQESKIYIKDTTEIEKIVTKNDSIYKVNDSINYKIITVEKVYETTVNRIINNTVDSNYSFFANYIERYCNYYNSDSIKGS